MSTDEPELELEQATVVYEGADGERTERTVDNEKLLYARDHWVLLAGTDDQGNDLMHQIPRGRVYHVERNVEKFEDEAATIRHRVESIAEELRQRLPGPIAPGGSDRHHTEEPPSRSAPIQVDADEPDHEGGDGEAADRSE